MHPLDGAYEMVNGAREHTDILKPLIQSFGQEVADHVTLEYQMGDTVIQGRPRRVPIGRTTAQVNTPAPLRISRLIGEVIQNLRIALDYLIYELARLDAKRVVDGTQFPIADTEQKFKELLRRYHLTVLIPEHIAAIKCLQPFDGCNWTKWLASFSNPAKHRTLTILKSPVLITLDPRVTKAILAGDHVSVNDYATITITFSDGTPVIEGLEQLTLMVVQTLDGFKSEFQ